MPEEPGKKTYTNPKLLGNAEREERKRLREPY